MSSGAVGSPLRFGIVGVGTQGGMYARLLLDGKVANARLGAVFDTDPSRLARAADWGVTAHESFDAMLADDEIDGVIIAVPHFDHTSLAITAIERGVPVMVDKPAGVYTKQVGQLNEAAQARPDVAFAIMFNQRTNPLYVDLRNLLASGELGTLRHTNWVITTWWRPQAYYEQSAWRATWGGEGGGVLVNQAPHQLDLWQWLCGIPETVFAKCGFGFRRSIAVEDEVNALVGFANGASGTFTTCTHDVVGTDRLEILCDRGKVVVDGSQTVTITRLVDDERALSDSMSAADVADLFRGKSDTSKWKQTETKTYESVWGKQHADVLANFAAHLLHGEPLIAPGTDGIHGVRLANAIHLSAWTGEEVSVSKFDDERYLALLNERIRSEGLYPERH
jgi:predicted dehydrogenase